MRTFGVDVPIEPKLASDEEEPSQRKTLSQSQLFWVIHPAEDRQMMMIWRNLSRLDSGTKVVSGFRSRNGEIRKESECVSISLVVR